MNGVVGKESKQNVIPTMGSAMSRFVSLIIHVNTWWDDYPCGLPRSLLKNIGKVIAIISPDNEAPETIADIQLGEERPLAAHRSVLLDC